MPDAESEQASEQQARPPNNLLEVHLKLGQFETRLVGTPETVLRDLLTFVSTHVPKIQLASKLSLSVDTESFLKSCEGILAITPEGVVPIVPLDALKDRDLFLLHLARGKLAYLTGNSPKDTITLTDIVNVTGRSSGTVAGRLSEMSTDMVQRPAKGEYRITTLGLTYLMNNILPKLRKLSEMSTQ